MSRVSDKMFGSIMDQEFEELYMASPLAKQHEEHIMEVSGSGNHLFSPKTVPGCIILPPAADQKAKVLQQMKCKSTLPVPNIRGPLSLQGPPTGTLGRPPGRQFVGRDFSGLTSPRTPQENIIGSPEAEALSPKNLTPVFLNVMGKRSLMSPNSRKFPNSIGIESALCESNRVQNFDSDNMDNEGRNCRNECQNHSSGSTSGNSKLWNSTDEFFEQDVLYRTQTEGQTLHEYVPEDNDSIVIVLDENPKRNLVKKRHDVAPSGKVQNITTKTTTLPGSHADSVDCHIKKTLKTDTLPGSHTDSVDCDIKENLKTTTLPCSHADSVDFDFKENFSPRITRMGSKRKQSLEKIKSKDVLQPSKKRGPKQRTTKEKKDEQKVLSNWVIKCVLDTICVEGDKEGESGELSWRSTGVVKRLNAHTVVTGTGSVYRLKGPMNVEDAYNIGFSKKIVKAFKNGFPVRWQAMVKEHLQWRKLKVRQQTTKVKTEERCREKPNTAIQKNHNNSKRYFGKSQVGTPITTSPHEEDVIDLTDLPTTRCGRRVKPQLAWWVRQRAVMYPRTNLVHLQPGSMDGSPVGTPHVFFKPDLRTELLQKRANEQLIKQTKLNQSIRTEKYKAKYLTSVDYALKQEDTKDCIAKEEGEDNQKERKGQPKKLEDGETNSSEEKEVLRKKMSVKGICLQGKKRNARLYSQLGTDYEDESTPLLAKKRKISNPHENAEGSTGTCLSESLTNKQTEECNNDNDEAQTVRMGGLRRSLTLQFKANSLDSCDSEVGKDGTIEPGGSDSDSLTSVNVSTKNMLRRSSLPSKLDKSNVNATKTRLHDKKKQEGLQNSKKNQPIIKLKNLVENKDILNTMRTTPFTKSVLAGKLKSVNEVSKAANRSIRTRKSSRNKSYKNQKENTHINKISAEEEKSSSQSNLEEDLLCQLVHEHEDHKVRRSKISSKNMLPRDIDDDCLSQPSEGEILIPQKIQSCKNKTAPSKNVKSVGIVQVTSTLSRTKCSERHSNKSDSVDTESACEDTSDQTSSLKHSRRRSKRVTMSKSKGHKRPKNVDCETARNCKLRPKSSKVNYCEKDSSSDSDKCDDKANACEDPFSKHSTKTTRNCRLRTNRKNSKVDYIGKDSSSDSGESDDEANASEDSFSKHSTKTTRNCRLRTNRKNSKVDYIGKDSSSDSVESDDEANASEDSFSKHLPKGCIIGSKKVRKKGISKSKNFTASRKVASLKKKEAKTGCHSEEHIKKSTRPDETDSSEIDRPWEAEESLQLKKAINTIPPDCQFYWEAVAACVPTRNAEECRKYHHRGVPVLQKKKPSRAKGKEKVVKLDQLSGKKGTVKRKRQLREILEHHNEGHEDDFFDSTPFKGGKVIKLPTIGEDSEDEFFNNRPDFQTPGSSHIFTPSSKFPWMPVSEKKTPSMHVMTPGLLHSVDRNAADVYINRLKRGRHRPSAQQNNKKSIPATTSQQESVSVPKDLEVDQIFETQKVIEEDSEEEKDFYFSDEN